MFTSQPDYVDNTRIFASVNGERQVNILRYSILTNQNSTLVIPVPNTLDSLHIYTNKHCIHHQSKNQKHLPKNWDVSTKLLEQLHGLFAPALNSIDKTNILSLPTWPYTYDIVPGLTALESWKADPSCHRLLALLSTVYTAHSFIVIYLNQNNLVPSADYKNGATVSIEYSFKMPKAKLCIAPTLKTKYSTENAMKYPVVCYMAGFIETKRFRIKSPLLENLFEDIVPSSEEFFINKKIIDLFKENLEPEDEPYSVSKIVKCVLSGHECIADLYVTGKMPNENGEILNMNGVLSSLTDAIRDDRDMKVNTNTKTGKKKNTYDSASLVHSERDEGKSQDDEDFDPRRLNIYLKSAESKQPPMPQQQQQASSIHKIKSDSTPKMSTRMEMDSIDIMSESQGETKKQKTIQQSDLQIDLFNLLTKPIDSDKSPSTMLTMEDIDQFESSKKSIEIGTTTAQETEIEMKKTYSVNIIAVQCNFCNGSIKGLRYRCKLCPDFDICDKCFREKNHVAPKVTVGSSASSAYLTRLGQARKSVDTEPDFLTDKPTINNTSSVSTCRHFLCVIESPEQEQYSSMRPKPFGHLKPTTLNIPIKCDYCQGNIIGFKYTCQESQCKRNLCESCIETSDHPDIHLILRSRGHLLKR